MENVIEATNNQHWLSYIIGLDTSFYSMSLPQK